MPVLAAVPTAMVLSTVTDGDITAKATGNYGAGIGGGFGAIPKDTLIGGNGTVTISGGTITEASGGYMAAGIGSGYQVWVQ